MNKNKALAVLEEIMTTAGCYVDLVDITRRDNSDEYRLRVKGNSVILENIEDIAQTHNLKLIEKNGLVLY